MVVVIKGVESMASLMQICNNCQLCDSFDSEKELVTETIDTRYCLMISGKERIFLSSHHSYHYGLFLKMFGSATPTAAISYSVRCDLPESEYDDGLISCEIYSRIVLRSYSFIAMTKEVYSQLGVFDFAWSSGTIQTFDYTKVLMIEDVANWTEELIESYSQKIASTEIIDKFNIIVLSEARKSNVGVLIQATEPINNQVDNPFD